MQDKTVNNHDIYQEFFSRNIEEIISLLARLDIIKDKVYPIGEFNMVTIAELFAKEGLVELSDGIEELKQSNFNANMDEIGKILTASDTEDLSNLI